jgi:sugar/nucleoside kinase (ribokinase family)
VALTDPTGAGDSFAGGFIGLLARLDRADGPVLRQAMAVAPRWRRSPSSRSRRVDLAR